LEVSQTFLDLLLQLCCTAVDLNLDRSTGLYLNSSPLFLFWPKTNRKNLPVPNVAQNWAKFAFLD
jgi:hypothetical protein